MTQPSKGAAAFLTLFGMPFMGMGLAFIYAQIVSRGNFKTQQTIAAILFGSVFVFIGGALIYAAIGGYGRLKKQAAIEEANPLSPWLWRTDWAMRRAESQNKKNEILFWVLAILCNMVTLPFLFNVVPNLIRSNDPRVFLVLGFNLIGAILIVKAVRTTMQHHRFGDTYFEFDSLPFVPGQRVAGRIQLKFDTQAEHGIDLRLSCVRKIITGSGKSQSTSKIVLWQSDKNVPSGAVGPGPLGRAIPVEFSPPSDCLPTNHDNPNDQILWLLHAKADVPGVDYTDEFEVPVFRSETSPATTNAFGNGIGSEEGKFGFSAAPSTDFDSGAVEQPAHPKVIVAMGSGGTEFYFRPLRNPIRALTLFVVTLVWTGVIYLMYLKHAPVLFFVFFGLADVIIVGGFLHVTFGSSRITVRSGEILFRKGILGIGSAQRFQASEVTSIVPVAGLQQGGNSQTAMHLIRMQLKSGRKVTLADEIDTRQEARWVVSQIETLAGLKLDTHVEVDLPLGVPAQPVFQSSGQVLTRTPSRTATTASWVSFFVFVAAMFGFMGWRMTSFAPRRNSARAAAAAPAKPAARRVFSGPLTDADVERVLALPAQAQAEELLERAIGHDPRALELFEQQVESWIGHINMTDRMRELERRSEFSKDLRVRYANADINLTLDGWQKNKQAADMLIERARTDANYRAAAVYFLGMLAGRGVDYDRIHGVLLNYARYDQDATVRQWAVEGLRFLGKDEALDDLFASFTEDPVATVRDRAGCNISDCGIFTRKQRMRMVPQLIDLVMKANTSAQMRSWCFLALQEITDESLPPDAMAWSRWYQEHGAEKMAAFERMEWWQVRGDE